VTLDGVAAVQARIAQIQQLVSAKVGVAGGGAPTTTAGTGTTTASAAQSPEFASLLADALASGSTSSDPLSDAPASSSAIGGSSLLNQLISQFATTGGAGLTGTGLTGTAPTATTPNLTTQSFLANALTEKGKPYVYGATARVDDPDPKSFDCSELTLWAAARAGVKIPDGATAQYLYIRDHGGTMSVQQALHTPGALLFHFGHEPKDLGDIPADGHVAISLGDGVHTIEARGHAYGTNVFDNAGGRSFNFAGMIPGMS
jgi:cell wall-associated NlpC family hydrolase